MPPTPDDETLAPLGLVVRAERDPGGLRLSLYGELDIATAPVLEARVAMMGPHARVVLDMSGLGFMDSWGLRTLITLRRRLADTGGSLALVRGPRAVHRVFELTGSDELFSFES